MPQITKKATVTTTPQSIATLIGTAYRGLKTPCKVQIYNPDAAAVYLGLSDTPAALADLADSFPIVTGAPSSSWVYEKARDEEPLDLNSASLVTGTGTVDVFILIIGA